MISGISIFNSVVGVGGGGGGGVGRGEGGGSGGSDMLRIVVEQYWWGVGLESSENFSPWH